MLAQRATAILAQMPKCVEGLMAILPANAHFFFTDGFNLNGNRFLSHGLTLVGVSKFFKASLQFIAFVVPKV